MGEGQGNLDGKRRRGMQRTNNAIFLSKKMKKAQKSNILTRFLHIFSLRVKIRQKYKLKKEPKSNKTNNTNHSPQQTKQTNLTNKSKKKT